MNLLGMLIAFGAGALLGALGLSGTRRRGTAPRRRGPYETLIRTAVARVAAGDNEAAVDALRQASQIDSGDDAFYLLLGELLRRTGDPSRASHVVEILLARREQKPEIAGPALLLKARIKAAEGSTSEALDAFAAAAEADPESPVPLVARGRLLSAQRRWQDAIDCGQQLTRLRPERGVLVTARRRVLLARELLADGQAKQALAEAETATKQVPQMAAASLTKGDALFQLGDVVRAAEAWRQTARLAPFLAALIIDRLEQIPGTSPGGESVRAFAIELIERHEPDDRQPWRLLAWLTDDALRRGAIDEASAWCKRLTLCAPYAASTARLCVRSAAKQSRDPLPAPMAELIDNWCDEPLWLGGWSCRRCGHLMNEFEWRCPRCQAWESFA